MAEAAVEMAKAQQEVLFAEVTAVQPVRSRNVAVTVWIAGEETDIHIGADTATVETVLRFLKSRRATSLLLTRYTSPAATLTCAVELTG